MPDEPLSLRVVKMKYLEKLNQIEIAKRLCNEEKLDSVKNLHPVKDLLHDGITWLINRNEILTKQEHENTPERDLARRLCEAYGLLDCRVVPGGDIRRPAEYPLLLKAYGREAAIYFDRVTSDANDRDLPCHVAVSGGQSILDMVSQLPDRKRDNVRYYAAAMVGRGITNPTPHVSPESNATIAWSLSGRIPGHVIYATVPPFDFTPQQIKDSSQADKHTWSRAKILNEVTKLGNHPQVWPVLNNMNKVINMAIAGLGLVQVTPKDHLTQPQPIEIERLTMTNLLEPFGIDLEALEMEGALGDISYNLFKLTGRGSDKWRFFLTAGYGSTTSGVDFYRNLVTKGDIVIVMAGWAKQVALVPAMRAGLFNVLITDSYSAQQLLELDRRQHGAGIPSRQGPGPSGLQTSPVKKS
jgi:DNA-binding transcriptional regulator LsrR (DeoR family)